MNCEQAAHLLSARIDGEIAVNDSLALDAHLAGCAACRQALVELELQDAAMIRAFKSQDAVAAAVADRVLAALPQSTVPAMPRINPRPVWLRQFWIAAAASIGLVAAAIAFHLHSRGDRPRTPTAGTQQVAMQPVAQLTLATGAVFCCPSGETTWRPIETGDAIAPGARVRTADTAKCELELAGGARVRLNVGTDACVADAATVRVEAGQVWSAVPQKVESPLKVIAGKTATVTAQSVPGERKTTQFEVACNTGTATVTVARGGADVAPLIGPGQATRVGSGEVLRIPAVSQLEALRCEPATDMALRRHWQDDLLVLKPHGDAEVAERVAELLRRISVERNEGSSPAASPSVFGPPGPTEQDVRGRGEAWANPFVCYVRGKSPAERESRRTAARLLADLAPASCIPDLIELLADEDEQVRLSAGAALRRLTGQDFGQSSAACAPAATPAIVAAWRAWWRQNEHRYTSRR